MCLRVACASGGRVEELASWKDQGRSRKAIADLAATNKKLDTQSSELSECYEVISGLEEEIEDKDKEVAKERKSQSAAELTGKGKETQSLSAAAIASQKKIWKKLWGQS